FSTFLPYVWFHVLCHFCLFLYITVEQPPTIINHTSSPVIVLPFENTLTIRCEARGNPPPEYRWTKDGQLFEFLNISTIKRDNKSGTFMLHSKHFIQFQGKYRCFASNKLGTAMTEEIEIKVLGKFPKEYYNPIVVKEGEPITLHCNPPKGVCLFVLHFKQDERVSMGTEGNLYFSYALLKDSHEDYCCFAAFQKIPEHLPVKAPSLLLPSSGQTTKVLRKGEDLQLECIPGGFPIPKITWMKLGKSLTDRVKLTNFERLLTITSVDQNDEGEYTCTAKNSAGKVDHYFSVRVEAPPQSLLSVVGSDVHIHCSVSGFPPPLYLLSCFFAIKKIYNKVKKSSYVFRYSVKGGLLQIMNVNLSDQGTYTCIAKTHLDEDAATAVLTVLDVPDAPTKLKISDIKSETNIVLTWVPGSDHNSSITEFVVEYEESHWEAGRWKELQKVVGNQATAELFLQGNLNYQFRVYAVNAIGPGPPSETTERYPTPPAAPDRNPENIKIQGHLPHQMDISWDPLLPIEYNGPGLEYNVSYRKLGVQDDWKMHLVQRPSFIVKDTPTFVPYEIKVQSRNSFGSGPEPKTVTGYSGEDVPTAAPQDVAVEMINSTAVIVSWTPVPPATVRGHLGGYNVYWQRLKSLLNPGKILNKSDSQSFPGNRSHVIVPGLEPFSEYKLTVNVFNKKGKGPRSDPVTFNTPEGVPGSVPILTTSNTQKNSVLLVWGPPLVSNGILSGYFLLHHLRMYTHTHTHTACSYTRFRSLNLWDFFSLILFSLLYSLSLFVVFFLLSGVTSRMDGISTQRWFIGTLCAVALLTLIVLMACFVRKNKGGKYAGTPPPQQQDMLSMAKGQLALNSFLFCCFAQESKFSWENSP
uniref:Cell adhesion molecule L1-like b n=1 Tax=Kryptolebias marmoratus TaxID=37003 RepID=A0A3Q3G8K4_KRYMA